MKFTKMQGCGNDYIYIDCFNKEVIDPEALSIRLSDRHFGIGGDGIVLICPPSSEKADVRMLMYNADGSQGNMCGNASRCIAKYMYEKRRLLKTDIALETRSGIKNIHLNVEGENMISARVDMGPAILDPKLIPVALDGDKVVNRSVAIGGRDYKITCVSVGNPHCVIFVKDTANLPLDIIGPEFENNEMFPDRINTEFIQVLNSDTIRMRVWERGSGETLACGTGACAAVVAAVLNGFCLINKEIKVELIGGKLDILYTGERVYMTGGAEFVFDGSVEV